MKKRKMQSVALFDVDGTLLDSAKIWQSIPVEYLLSRGIQPTEEIRELFARLGYSGSARYLQAQYFTGEDPHTIMDGFCRIAACRYKDGVTEKPGAAAYLRYLKQKGVRCSALTSNLRDIVLPALEQLGMLENFDRVTSIYDVGMDKRSPEIFRYMAQHLDTLAQDCVVFEDALFAAQSAKNAGMRVVGVFDCCASHEWQRMQQIADRSIHSYEELIEYDVFA